jgi:8-oxo-dGTP diphosphatase
MAYALNGKIKIVQFWHMRAVGEPAGKLTNDVKAVKWLSLKQAIETLTRAHEKVFLANVGPAALKAVKQSKRPKSRKADNDARRAAKSAPYDPGRETDERRDASQTPFVAAFGGLGHLAHASTRRIA